MKRIFFQYTFLALLLCINTLAVKSQVPRLEIHHIGVADGDATLIIGIDTTATGYIDTVTVLIDGQRSSHPGARIWEYVKDTLKALSPKRKILDILVLSHVHIDHYGGLNEFMTSLADNKWTIGTVIDREGKGFPTNLTWTLDSSFKYVCVTQKVTYSQFTASANKYAANANKYDRVTVQPGSNIFAYKNFKHLTMYCLAAVGSALVKTPLSFKTEMFLKYNATSRTYVPYNENDLSFVFNIGFNTFNFFTGGDIGGGAPYADGETPVAKFLADAFNGDFHYCAIKVSHHGSAHSTNANFLSGVKPSLAVIPASLRSYSGTALPTQTTINALLNSTVGQNIKFCFAPYNPGTWASYWTVGNRQYYQDVVLKVIGLPVMGNNINIRIGTRKRDNTTLLFTEPQQASTFTCTQSHTCYFQ